MVECNFVIPSPGQRGVSQLSVPVLLKPLTV
nr:MAG TPA: hypothetical protein [Caudoviricetes sp.]